MKMRNLVSAAVIITSMVCASCAAYAQGTTQCADGIDNDNDGAVDLADFSCSSGTDTDETYPKAECQDGIDNDGDGKIDFNGVANVTAAYAATAIASNGAQTTIATGLVAGQKLFLSLAGSIRIDSGGSTVQCSTGDPSR